MKLKNTEHHFGLVSILLHWVIAFLIIYLLAIGIYMTRIPVSGVKLKLFRWHKEYGFIVFFLIFLRLCWRLFNITPTLSALPRWEQVAARSVHWLFYILIIIICLSGWFISSAAGLPISFFGLFLVPVIFPPSEYWRLFFTAMHQWASYFLIFLICLHIAAAFKHSLLNKDDILRRILWP